MGLLSAIREWGKVRKREEERDRIDRHCIFIIGIDPTVLEACILAIPIMWVNKFHFLLDLSWICVLMTKRASPSLAAKDIINLISVLAICWCPYIESSLVLLEEVFAMTSAFSWQNSISLCPASFCTPRPNTPGVSWLPTFAYQSPIRKRTSFLGVSSKRSCRSS